MLQRFIYIASQICVNFPSCWFGNVATWITLEKPICLSENTRESPSLSIPCWCPSGPSDEQIANIIWCDTRHFDNCCTCPILNDNLLLYQWLQPCVLGSLHFTIHLLYSLPKFVSFMIQFKMLQFYISTGPKKCFCHLSKQVILTFFAVFFQGVSWDSSRDSE